MYNEFFVLFYQMYNASSSQPDGDKNGYKLSEANGARCF